jgi:hypothetical protein
MELNQRSRPNRSKDFIPLLAFSAVDSSLLAGMILNA